MLVSLQNHIYPAGNESSGTDVSREADVLMEHGDVKNYPNEKAVPVTDFDVWSKATSVDMKPFLSISTDECPPEMSVGVRLASNLLLTPMPRIYLQKFWPISNDAYVRYVGDLHSDALSGLLKISTNVQTILAQLPAAQSSSETASHLIRPLGYPYAVSDNAVTKESSALKISRKAVEKGHRVRIASTATTTGVAAEETRGWVMAGIAGASLTTSAFAVFLAKQAVNVSKQTLQWNKKKDRKTLKLQKRAQAYAEWKDERDHPNKPRWEDSTQRKKLAKDGYCSASNSDSGPDDDSSPNDAGGLDDYGRSLERQHTTIRPLPKALASEAGNSRGPDPPALSARYPLYSQQARHPRASIHQTPLRTQRSYTAPNSSSLAPPVKSQKPRVPAASSSKAQHSRDDTPLRSLPSSVSYETPSFPASHQLSSLIDLSPPSIFADTISRHSEAPAPSSRVIEDKERKDDRARIENSGEDFDTVMSAQRAVQQGLYALQHGYVDRAVASFREAMALLQVEDV
ncbi:hypothetical protein BU16DRAFT_527452 [Lophium mytilinum]|uniref:Uncharacterized protein n=1 Tax=Lophium mytilinum TaxID=390894 RepID=A0A6A6QU15_9PEZI|nr:hypothetical protein BU16DRAFT_527452 [Lophium mytilinum]